MMTAPDVIPTEVGRKLIARGTKGANVDIGTILSELKGERDRLNQAIAALEGIDSANSARPAPVGRAARKRRKGLTAEGRKRLSEMMKKRWAERRKKLASIRKPAKKAA